MYQWRILVNGETAASNPTFNAMPSEQWSSACGTAERRGLKVTLERRFVCAEDPRAAWEVVAEYDDRNPFRIAALVGE